MRLDAHFGMLPERAFNKVRFTLEGGGKSDAPAPPDYAGAAAQTAQGNLEAARASAAANRVNQTTPYGSLTYSHTGSDPDNGWSATQTLAPAQQQILDQTNQLNSGLMGTANTGLQYANQVLSRPGVDTSKLPQTGFNPGQSYQDAIMSRLQPNLDAQSKSFDQQMANQGIGVGTEAYTNAKRALDQKQNDLMSSATVNGLNAGMTANQNAFQQQAYNQMQPINVINALRTGSQVQNPSFVNVPQQQTTAGADLLGATQATYNANLNATNAKNAGAANTMNGLFSLGSAYLGGI